PQPAHYAPPQLPLHTPFAQAPAPQPMQYAAPQLAPVAYQAPVSIPHAGQAPMQPQGYAMPVEPQVEPAEVRKVSRAPEGMGSTLRLDDPSLRDTMDRAKVERAELAVEYRKLSAPLVDVAGAPPAAPVAHDPQQLQHVGHDQHGVPLFVGQQGYGHEPSAQYPAPARIPADPGVRIPHPQVTVGPGQIDNGQLTAAFQRPTPYAPNSEREAAHA
ncbi:MAG: hypothetical protein ABI200_00240, partial [Gaiellales bacterium]